MSDYHPADPQVVRANGVRGVLSAGAGVGLVLFNMLTKIPVIGYILSGGLVVIGVMGFLGKDKTDKATSSILMGAGILGLASMVVPGLIGLAALALIGYGGYNLFKFKGVKTRA